MQELLELQTGQVSFLSGLLAGGTTSTLLLLAYVWWQMLFIA